MMKVAHTHMHISEIKKNTLHYVGSRNYFSTFYSSFSLNFYINEGKIFYYHRGMSVEEEKEAVGGKFLATS